MQALLGRAHRQGCYGRRTNGHSVPRLRHPARRRRRGQGRVPKNVGAGRVEHVSNGLWLPDEVPRRRKVREQDLASHRPPDCGGIPRTHKRRGAKGTQEGLADPDAASRISRARPHSGTRCWRFAFARCAGTVHTPSFRSISAHSTHRTSPHRAAVSTRNSNASRTPGAPVDACTVRMAAGTSR